MWSEELEFFGMKCFLLRFFRLCYRLVIVKSSLIHPAGEEVKQLLETAKGSGSNPAWHFLQTRVIVLFRTIVRLFLVGLVPVALWFSFVPSCCNPQASVDKSREFDSSWDLFFLHIEKIVYAYFCLSGYFGLLFIFYWQKRFFYIYFFFFSLILLIVIHMCIASGAKLSSASVELYSATTQKFFVLSDLNSKFRKWIDLSEQVNLLFFSSLFIDTLLVCRLCFVFLKQI